VRRRAEINLNVLIGERKTPGYRGDGMKNSNRSYSRYSEVATNIQAENRIYKALLNQNEIARAS